MKKHKLSVTVPEPVSETDQFANFWLIFLFFFVGIICFVIGRVSVHTPKEKQTHTTDMFYDQTHYVIVEGREGGITIVNYTLDSIRKESARPTIQFFTDPNMHRVP